MGEQVTFPSNGDSADGYLAVPESGSGPGVIVIQEWWGLVPHIRDVADRFAAEGFVALAPDLYHGITTSEPDEAGIQQARAAIEAAGGTVEVHGYDGTAHAFFNDTRPEVHDPAAAALAWDRTLALFRERL